MVDVAGDTAAVLDELGADSFVTAGWSGGGPHALACAAALPGRCLAAASIAGVAPYQAPGLDWTAGMGPENVEEFGAALAGEAELTAFLERAAATMGTVTGPDVAQAFGGLVIEADQAVLTGEFADHMATCLRAAPLRAAIWQGDQDRMVPFAHGQWLAASIPGARVHLMPGDGHLSMTVSAFDRILDDLLDLAGLSSAP